MHKPAVGLHAADANVMHGQQRLKAPTRSPLLIELCSSGACSSDHAAAYLDRVFLVDSMLDWALGGLSSAHTVNCAPGYAAPPTFTLVAACSPAPTWGLFNPLWRMLRI